MEPSNRREQLLLAARAIFARKGYHAASVADVVELAGVARGTFYNYFDGKREIFDAVLADVALRVEGAVVPIDVGRPIPAQVRENVRRVVEALLREGEGVRLLFAEAVGVDPEGRAALRAFSVAAHERVARALRLGQRLGVIRPLDADVLAHCIVGMVKEPVFHAVITGSTLNSADLVETVLRVLDGGVLLAEVHPSADGGWSPGSPPG